MIQMGHRLLFLKGMMILQLHEAKISSIVLMNALFYHMKVYLKRHSSFYRSYGWNVLVKIASPSMIVDASMNPIRHTSSTTRILKEKEASTMSDLAYQTIQEIHCLLSDVYGAYVFQWRSFFMGRYALFVVFQS